MADGFHQHFSPSLAESPLTSSPSVLIQQRSPKSQTPDSIASLVSIQKSSSMLAEILVRRSSRLVQSDQKMENVSKRNGFAVNSVFGKKIRKSQQSASEAPSSEQQALHMRRSPRLVGNVDSGIGKRVNSTAKNGLMGKTKMQQQALHMRRSPMLVGNVDSGIGKRVNSTAKNGLTGKTKMQQQAVHMRRSPRLVGNVDSGIGKRVNSTAKNGLTEKTKMLQQAFNMRRSPRLVGNVDSDIGKRVNSTAKNGLTGKTKMQQQSLHLSSSKRSPKLIESIKVTNCKRLRSPTRQDGLAETSPAAKKNKTEKGSSSNREDSVFIGDPIPDDEARMRWPWRYEEKKVQSNMRCKLKHDADDSDDDALVLNVKCHYSQAKVLKRIFSIGDCAYIKGEEGGPNYVGRILEFFETLEGDKYFRTQWFFRERDTVIQGEAMSHDKKRLFYSTLMNDNLLDCIVSKVQVVQITPSVNLKAPTCDFYYDMKYSVDYSTFSTMETCIPNNDDDTKSNLEGTSRVIPHKSQLSLLDMYSGCGAMSAGLCLGATAAGVDLVTKWAVDINSSACESLRLNEPQAQVRNESAEDFLDLLKEWDKLCKRYGQNIHVEDKSSVTRAAGKDPNTKADVKNREREYEVGSLVDICYSDPTETGKRGLKFQVRWVGYSPSEDTWETIEALSKCQERIRDFVIRGMKEKILPRPGDVDVVCGGPPCQGISGYNRFRNVQSPLDDERNRQIIIFMDVVKFLRPKFILMENVIDILRFANGCLGRYALGRLVQMNYQARLGIMAAGCYGLPQFRPRVFIWGAHPFEILPQFPLPTHDVVIHFGFPVEFERNVVAYDEGQSRKLEKAIVLSDAISDLPSVSNTEVRGKMSYTKGPQTEFQKYIRAAEWDMLGFTSKRGVTVKTPLLYDHQPHPLFEDDYMRACQIPKRKGASFRDLPGVVVGDNNVVRRTEKQFLMPSGKPWVPDYALNFRDGRSRKPFARLWWDETVPTVFCKPDCHLRAVIHPEQDRVLTIREFARLQGFHDYYKFYGTVKERYSQIGNAVAIPVGRALGFALGMAMQKLSGDNKSLMTLPPKFSHSTTVQLQSSREI